MFIPVFLVPPSKVFFVVVVALPFETYSCLFSFYLIFSVSMKLDETVTNPSLEGPSGEHSYAVYMFQVALIGELDLN